MKCKKCGHKNIDGNKFCSECGEPLSAGKVKDSFDEQWDALAAEAEIANAKQDAFLSELEDRFTKDFDEPEPAPQAPDKDRTVHTRGERSNIKRRSEQRRQDETVAVNPGRSRGEDRGASEKNGSRHGGSLLNRILLIVLIAALVALAVLVFHSLKDGIGTGGSKRSKSDVKLNPNDPNKYYVTVRANEGTKVVFEGTDGSKKELDVSSKQDVTFNVHASSLLPQDYIETETVTVKPQVFQIDGSGNKSIIDVPEVEIDVPKIKIEFETPDYFESDDGIVTVRGSLATSQLKAQLAIGTDKLQVDEFGNFAYSVKRDKGEHKFEFIARMIGHMTLRKTFTANVTRVLTAEQIIVIQPTFHTRSLNVEESIRVYGAVPPGAHISIASNDPEFSLKSEPEIDEVGNFSFEVNLPTPAKAYKFLITAKLEDGAVFERPFSVERPPVYNDYVPTVWPGGYEEMMKPIHVTDMRGFLIKGTVTEIIYDGDYLVAKFTLDSGELIEIEYHDHYSTASDLQEGSHYTMYGYSLGTSVSPDGNLRLFIWFVQD